MTKKQQRRIEKRVAEKQRKAMGIGYSMPIPGMNDKQRQALKRNRESQRLALHEHMTCGTYAASKDLPMTKPPMASRPIAGDKPFNTYLRLPKNAA